MRTLIIFRCCEYTTNIIVGRHKRPEWFSKERCLNSVLSEIDSDTEIVIVHDGPIGTFYNKCQSLGLQIIKLNGSHPDVFVNNEESFRYCCRYGKDRRDYDNIYLLEDDYLHRPGWENKLHDGLDNLGLLSLFDHIDRYRRTDDICFNQESIKVINDTHWRTHESTTCTWAATKNIFDRIVDSAIREGLEDRRFFRECYNNGIRLWNPIPGYSTHCEKGGMSAGIDWKQVSELYDKC